MRTSGRFMTCSYTIPVTSVKQEFYIVPWSDVHYGSRLFCLSTWKEFARWGMKTPTAYYIGNGDYLDAFRAHTRSVLEHQMTSGERDPIDNENLRRVGEFERLMGFMAGRLIGVGDGNHDWTFADGRNTAEVIAHDFGCEYLGVLAAIRINFDYQGCVIPITYVQHHGRASTAQTAGGKFNAVERMARSYDADIVATGDDHKKGITWAQTRVKFMTHGDRLIPKEYTPLLVRSGGCLKMLEPGVSTYQVDANYAPLALGFNAVRIKISRSCKTECKNRGPQEMRLKMGAYDII